MDFEATEAEKQQLAYSTQFFDFTPEVFVDNLSAPSLTIIEENLDATKTKIASEFSGKVQEKDLNESFASIKDAYVSHAGEVFDKFGRYLKKNILTIPPNVVLPEDRPHNNPEAKDYTSQSLADDLQKINHLKQDIINAKYSKAVLEAKLSNLEAVAQRQQQLMERAELLQMDRSERALIDGQFDILKTKLNSFKSVLETIDNNLGSSSDEHNLKRSFELKDALFAKKNKLDKEN